MAFLVLLETLSPSERAAYLLREVFDYEFEEIAALLDKTAGERPADRRPGAGSRLESKERRFLPTTGRPTTSRIGSSRPAGRATSTPSNRCWRPTRCSYSDGGGKAFAAPRPIYGRRRIAKLLSVILPQVHAALRRRWHRPR